MPTENSKVILLTGIHRSGTSLVCYLLNSQEGFISLNEPIDFSEIFKTNDSTEARNTGIRLINNFIDQTRTDIIHGRPVWSKTLKGLLSPTMFEEMPHSLQTQLRKDIQERSLLNPKPYLKDFTLVVKHPAAFTALLTQLRNHDIYAVIKNPLHILASWETCAIATREGHAPVAEQLDEGLKRDLSISPNRLDRQLNLLRWFYSRYNKYLSTDKIIKYEDIVGSKGKKPIKINDNFLQIDDAQLQIKPTFYPIKLLEEIWKRLENLRMDDPLFSFYNYEVVKKIFTDGSF